MEKSQNSHSCTHVYRLPISRIAVEDWPQFYLGWIVLFLLIKHLSIRYVLLKPRGLINNYRSSHRLYLWRKATSSWWCLVPWPLHPGMSMQEWSREMLQNRMPGFKLRKSNEKEVEMLSGMFTRNERWSVKIASLFLFLLFVCFLISSFMKLIYYAGAF